MTVKNDWVTGNSYTADAANAVADAAADAQAAAVAAHAAAAAAQVTADAAITAAGAGASWSGVTGKPKTVYAEEFGVIADGSPHNNGANLLDAFAYAYAAGARQVILPAGVIDTSDAVIGTVTAASGSTYTNNGGIPLPTGDQAVTISGQGRGVTTLKLSEGFPRAFDFWFAATNQSYKNITIRDMTVDRDNLLGTDIAPSTAVTGGVTLTPSTWVTLPGVSAVTFKNAQYVFFPTANAGTAQTRRMPSRVSGGDFQVYNDGASATLILGDLVQGSMQGHVICGTLCGTFRVGINMYIDSVLVDNVDAINVADSSADGVHTAAADRSAGINVSVYLNAGMSPSSVPRITNFRARNVRVYGGSTGIAVNGENVGTFCDEIWFEDCFHDTLIDPTTTWNSSNYLIGVYAWVNRCGIIRCVGRRSGDIAYEIDQPWEGRVEDCLWEEAFTGCYTTTFTPPARTMAGPPTTTLNNGGALAIGGTSVVVTALPSGVARSGLAQIDSEIVWYVANEAGTTFTLTRAVNGSTAASHADGTTVTFVQVDKCHLWDIRSTVRNKDILATTGAGRAWMGYENQRLPYVPMSIRDANVEFIGGKLMVGHVMYWEGWRPALDIQGMNFSWDSVSHTAPALSGSVISWDWPAGSTLAVSGITCPQPLIFGRNNTFRVHGTIGDVVRFAALETGRGYARLDFDLTSDTMITGGDYNSTVACKLGAPTGVFVAAPGTRVGVKMRMPWYDGNSDFAPTGVYVNNTSKLTITSMIDVDVDLYEMSFINLGDGVDTHYRGWIVDATQVGKVRFGKIIHSSTAVVGYPAVKKMTKVVTANYTAGPEDEILLVNTSGGGVTILLPNTAAGNSSVGEPYTRGRELKIIDSGFAAATNNITISPASGNKIDNGTAGADVVINTNGGRRVLIAHPGMPGWIGV